MIRLQQITHRFESEKIMLSNVSLAVRPGENFVLIGPSGHGKSTLLKLISGLIQPQRGTVLINETDIYNCAKNRRIELMNKMGMLFQKNALFDSLSVGENLAFPLREVSDLNEEEI